MAVRVDPHPTQQEGENALPEALHKAVSQYVATGLKYQPRIARRVRLPLAYIRQNIVKETWPEPVHITYGTWVQMHVLLQFDHQAKQRIQQECDKLIVAERLWYTGGGVAAVLAVLSLVFAGLKIDQATKGTCRGRLSLAGVVAVLAVLGGGYYGLHSLWAYPVTPHPAPPAVKPIEPASGAASERTEGSAPGVPTAAVNVQGRPATWVVLLPISALVLVGIALLVNRKSRVAVLAALALAAVVFVSALLVHLPKGAPGMHIRPGPTELIILGVVAIPMLIATITSSNRWAWILGYLVCFVVPALFTPADPASMLLLAVPLCCIFSLAVLAWKVPAKDAHEKALRRDPASPPAEQ